MKERAVATTLYLLPEDHCRLRRLAADRDVAAETLLLDAIDMLFERDGQGRVQRWEPRRNATSTGRRMMGDEPTLGQVLAKIEDIISTTTSMRAEFLAGMDKLRGGVLAGLDALRIEEKQRTGNTMDNLYDTDVVTWSEHQAALLRRVAAGEAPNEAPDWANIIEEVESVGQSQIDAVESLLFQAFLHDLKAEAWPLARDVPNWRGDARGFRAQARRKYRPSMRQKIDVAGLYADALQTLPETLDGQTPLPVPTMCPVTSIDELMVEP